MIWGVIGLGAIYLALRDGEKKGATAPNDPVAPPQAVPTPGDDIRLSTAGQGDGGVISKLERRSGQTYDDGSNTLAWSDAGYVRGSVATGFVRANTRVSGSDTFTIDGVKYENVLVYSSLEAAIEADKKEEPKPDDPVKPPEEEEPPAPTFPTQPSLPGFGGGQSSYFGGAF